MGISRLSAMIIQTRGDEIKPEVLGQSGDTSKWAGALALFKGDEFDYYLVTSTYVYDTHEEALECMQSLIDKIRSPEIE